MNFIPHAAMLLTSLLFIIYTAKIDAEHINKDEYITNHSDRWMQRLFFFLAFGFVHSIYSIASALLFTALFDQILNFLRGKHWLYLGTVSAWDKLFKERK